MQAHEELIRQEAFFNILRKVYARWPPEDDANRVSLLQANTFGYERLRTSKIPNFK
ncbi:hypothetical protein FHS18_001029 [Paenibacillus phyllosphaerae]|uniref:Uncharacterized protein n=1 Tax=Paenibacillus phyllosphaerae TaxID=274593 RepID=A0A7W5AUR8_9BACL|nr:hypothetical protein [Paenibacillus phyllosphaerae]